MLREMIMTSRVSLNCGGKPIALPRPFSWQGVGVRR